MKTELEPQVVDAIERGSKIEAIKILRELRGIGLKESKDLVDKYYSENQVTAPQGQVSTSGNGLLWLVVIGIVLYLLYKYFG